MRLTDKEKLRREKLKLRNRVKMEKKKVSIPVLSKKADDLWNKVIRKV